MAWRAREIRGTNQESEETHCRSLLRSPALELYEARVLLAAHGRSIRHGVSLQYHKIYPVMIFIYRANRKSPMNANI